MKTNSMEELKKITIDISNQDFTYESNSFFSVRFDTSNYKSLNDLTYEEKLKALLKIHLGLLTESSKYPLKEKYNIDLQTPEYFENKLKPGYELNEIDYFLLGLYFPNIIDNPLYYNFEDSLKDFIKNGHKFIVSLNYRHEKIANNLIAFLNLDLSSFSGFFSFFLTFLCEFIDKIPEKYKKEILLNQIPDHDPEKESNIISRSRNEKFDPIDMHMLEKAARTIYKQEIDNVIEMQSSFKSFIDYIFNNNNETYLKPYSIKQRFYIASHINTSINKLAENYTIEYPLKYIISSFDFTADILTEIAYNNNKKPLSDEKFLLESIKKDDINNNIHAAHCTFSTNSIYTYFYITLYNLTLSNNLFIKKCQNCNKYFKTNKSNIAYCYTENGDGTSCKSLGTKQSQKRKEKNEPVYGKYRKIYAKKAMMVKRNPDIESYKINYENWKKEAKQFIEDIKKETKTYEEFDKWLDKN